MAATRFDPFHGFAPRLSAEEMMDRMEDMERESFSEWLLNDSPVAMDLYESAWVAYRIAQNAWLREVLDFGYPVVAEDEDLEFRDEMEQNAVDYFEYGTIDGVYAVG